MSGSFQRGRRVALRLLLAAGFVVVALVLRFELMPADARPAFATFSPAMVLCFLLCGFAPGVLATAACAVLTYYSFIPPFRTFAEKPAGEVATLLFILSSLLIGMIIRHLRAKERVLEQLAAKQTAILEADLIGAAKTCKRRILWANPGLERLFGYETGALAGAPTRLIYPDGEAYAAIAEVARPVLAGGGTYRAEVEMVRKDGERIWVDLAGKVLDTDTSESLWLFADITPRRQAEDQARAATLELERTLAAAHASEARYRLLAENANDMIATMSPDSTILFVTPAVQRVLGYTPEEVVGRKTLELTHPDDIGATLRVFASLIGAGPDGASAPYEFRGLHKNGSWVWLEGQPRVEFDPSGAPLYFQDVVRDVSSRKNAEAALRTSRAFLARTSEAAGVGGWEYDLASETLTWSDETCRLHDLEPGHQPTLAEAISYYEPEARVVIEKAVRAGIHSGKGWDLELPSRSANGRRFWARAVGAPEFERGRVVRLVGAFQDVTEQRRIARDLAKSHDLLQVTLQAIGDAVVTTDARGMITWLNAAAQSLTEWKSEECEGKPLAHIFRPLHEETRLPLPDPVAECLGSGASRCLAAHSVMLSRSGKEYGVEGSVSPLHDDHETLLGAVVVLRDTSEQRRHGRELTYRATHDPLTGLANRAEFEARISQLLAQRHEEDPSSAVLFIDLDQFKLVNDSCGHTAGDELLKQVGTLFHDSVRGTDLVARLGGDEFGILLDRCEAGIAAQIAQKICGRIDQFRFLHEGKRYRVGTSIGLVPVTRNWVNTAALIKAADTACYAAKEAGRNRVHVWIENDHAIETRQGQMQWVRRIQTAIDENEFELFAQRIVCIDGAEEGLNCEVLLRLRQPDGSLISPGVFLPAAERFFLATHIDRWVVKRVFEMIEAGWTAGLPIARISINLSGQSIGDRSFHLDLLDMLAAAKFDVRVLCFEITETAAITNLADARAFIEAVRALGVRIALDDFGAGASSFGYLKNFPIDYIKIDGQFVQHILDDRLDQVAVRCFVDFAQAMGVTSIAECIETSAVLHALGEFGVDMAQGYLLHMPERLANLMLARAEGSKEEVLF